LLIFSWSSRRTYALLSDVIISRGGTETHFDLFGSSLIFFRELDICFSFLCVMLQYVVTTDHSTLHFGFFGGFVKVES